MTWKQPASSMTEPMNQDFHFSGGTTVRGDPVIDVRRRSGCIGADRQRIAGMGRYIAAISMVVGLAFSLPALPQAPAVTATCKDGTTFSGPRAPAPVAVIRVCSPGAMPRHRRRRQRPRPLLQLHPTT